MAAATTSLSDSHPWALKRLDACRESGAETLSTGIPFYFYVHRAKPRRHLIVTSSGRCLIRRGSIRNQLGALAACLSETTGSRVVPGM